MRQFRKLFLGLLCSLCAANAYAQPYITTTPEVIEYFHTAYSAADWGDYRSAIAVMREADKLPNVTPSERAHIADSILSYSYLLDDREGMLAQVQFMLANEIGDATKNLEVCLRLLEQLRGDALTNGECQTARPLGGADSNSAP